MIWSLLVLGCLLQDVCFASTTTVTVDLHIDVTDDVMAGSTSPDTLPSSDVTTSSDEWHLLERVRVFSTMTTSYNWSARFDDRDRENTWTIVMAYTYWRGYFGSLSVQNGAVYITTAIEDYFARNNNGLEHYYFE